jgi:SAM-dependent methyltransferase
VIRTLDRVVAADPGKPTRAKARESQAASRAIAEDPGSWSPAQAREAARRYAGLAAVWDSERGEYRSVPLADALARGGPLPAGLCVEVGCGTGLLTPLLDRIWPRVLCLDLTPEMLRRSAARWRIRADASRLPIGTGRAAAAVLADVPLFAGEVVRVLAPDGVVVWSNALGYGAPHHVPVQVVLAALQRADPAAGWEAVTAEAGWGLWAVLRRRPA